MARCGSQRTNGRSSPPFPSRVGVGGLERIEESKDKEGGGLPAGLTPAKEGTSPIERSLVLYYRYSPTSTRIVRPLSHERGANKEFYDPGRILRVLIHMTNHWLSGIAMGIAPAQSTDSTRVYLLMPLMTPLLDEFR